MALPPDGLEHPWASIIPVQTNSSLPPLGTDPQGLRTPAGLGHVRGLHPLGSSPSPGSRPPPKLPSDRSWHPLVIYQTSLSPVCLPHGAWLPTLAAQGVLPIRLDRMVLAKPRLSPRFDFLPSVLRTTHNKSRTADQIFIKSGTEIMPLAAVSNTHLCFLQSVSAKTPVPWCLFPLSYELSFCQEVTWTTWYHNYRKTDDVIARAAIYQWSSELFVLHSISGLDTQNNVCRVVMLSQKRQSEQS
jgi:hypothetical protein